MLSIVAEPVNYEMMFESAMNTYMQTIFSDNRVGIQLNTTIDSNLLFCQARHGGMSTSTPTISWIVNGRMISTSNCTSCFASSVYIANFTASDAGVYQCIVTDTDDSGEVVTSTPLRLDTGLCISDIVA